MSGAQGRQLIRRVSTGFPGVELYLAPMPGRYGPLDEMMGEMEGLAIDTVVSLAPLSEIREKSPGYAGLIDEGGRGCSFMFVPVEDFGVPADRESFASDVERAASMLAGGRRLLVHCGAGIGRTGTFACCLLIALGATPAESASAVRAAGSGPETPGQEALVGWFAAGHQGGTAPRKAAGCAPPALPPDLRDAIFGLTTPGGGRMTEIRWTESLSTGVETIDLQHKELIDRIRSLSDAVRMRQGTTRTTATLEFLSEYVHMHFSAEEKAMSDASFPGLPRHVEKHDEFRGALAKLEEDLIEDGSTDVFAESVNTFLFNWLSDHIMTWDRRLGEHLRASEKGSSGKDAGS